MLRHATLMEVETQWTLKELLDYHEAQDIQEEAEEFYRARAEQK